MQRLEGSEIPVISVLRHDAPDKEKPKEVTYSVCQNEKLIRIVVGDVALLDIEQTEFGVQAQALFRVLTAGKDKSDTKYAATRSFMERAQMFRLKSSQYRQKRHLFGDPRSTFRQTMAARLFRQVVHRR